MKLTLVSFFLILLTAIPAFAEKSGSFKQYLSQARFSPDRQDLEHLFPDSVEKALSIIDSKQNVGIRSRALQVLVLFPKHKKTNIFLRQMFEKNQNDTKFLPSIIIALGEVEGEAAVLDISPFLKSSDAGVRMAAIIALGRYGGQSGGDVLAEYVDAEKSAKHLVRIRVYLN